MGRQGTRLIRLSLQLLSQSYHIISYQEPYSAEPSQSWNRQA